MYEFLAYKVRHVMTVKVIAVDITTPLSKIGELFDQHDFNAMPVLDGDRNVVGWVSKLDFLEAFAFSTQSMIPAYQKVIEKPVESIMTRALIAVEPELPLTTVLGKMVASRHKSFPVLEDGRLVGIVAREDVLRAIRHAAAGQRPSD
jgi:CBS domain-containing protein